MNRVLYTPFSITLDIVDAEAGLKHDLVSILELKTDGNLKEKVIKFMRKLTYHCNLEIQHDQDSVFPIKPFLNQFNGMVPL